jgi:hypothetical protein
MHLRTSVNEDVVGKRPVFSLGGIATMQTLPPLESLLCRSDSPRVIETHDTALIATVVVDICPICRIQRHGCSFHEHIAVAKLWDWNIRDNSVVSGLLHNCSVACWDWERYLG